MSDKPVAPDQGDAPSNAKDAPPRTDEDFRLLCRRYSRFRSRTPG
jgi:hypothetical protein